ncbi:MAG TPA: RimK/LysX family protein [Bacteriovoracaceae bacterium]|nr:RimK/LysX family protein [Bacteriovoracaceae bacterium]
MKYFSILLLFVSLGASAQLLKEKILIGRVEWISLPELEIKHKSRIDTGAKTSSLHAVGIEEVQQGGALFVKFQSVDFEGKPKEFIRKVESMQRVVNPGGGTTKRYVIREKVKLGSIEKDISINLNDRTKMEYKFLVGRNLLLGRFVVDVARSHVLGD